MSIAGVMERPMCADSRLPRVLDCAFPPKKNCWARVQPHDVPEAAARLVALRDHYERQFGELVAALPVTSVAGRRNARLMLLGALNWVPTWYRPGKHAPGDIARAFVAALRTGLGHG